MRHLTWLWQNVMVPLLVFGVLVAIVIGGFMLLSRHLDSNRLERQKRREAKHRWTLYVQTCELLRGEVFADGRCYRNIDGQVVLVEVPPLPEVSK